MNPVLKSSPFLVTDGSMGTEQYDGHHRMENIPDAYMALMG